MRWSGILVLTVALGACTAPGRSDRPTPDELEAELTQFLDAYRAALDGLDVDVVRTMYVSDSRFQWIEDGAVRYRSADDVIAALSALSDVGRPATEYRSREVALLGDTGARVSSEFETLVGEAPSAYSFGGMISFVLERGPDGWRIVGGHSSTERRDGR